ncbi:MAG TPA: YihY/virulence factor BrkB family protein [Caulobacterales bacterium]|nr:YihY/virulence factor BrkB family protein [Caulobacterales bacterium]
MSAEAHIDRPPSHLKEIRARQWRALFRDAMRQAGRDNLGLVAAGVAFFVLMATFPSLAAIVALYGLLGDPVGVSAQIDALSGIAPDPVLNIARGQVARLIHADPQTLALNGFVSLAVAVWSAQQGARSFLHALTIINEHTVRRTFVKRYLIGGAFTLGALAMALLTVFLFTLAPHVLAAMGTDAKLLMAFLRWPVLLALMTVFALALYRWGPNRKPPAWRWIAPGALFASVAWLTVSALFSVYVDLFTPLRAAYGVFSGVFVLMLWFFISAYVFLFGAELNARMERLCQLLGDEAVEPSSPRRSRTSSADPLGAERR